MLYKIHEEIAPNLLDYFQAGKIDLAINVVDTHLKKDLNDDYFIRRAAVDSNILVFTKIKQAQLFIQALVEKGLSKLEIKSWSEYTKERK